MKAFPIGGPREPVYNFLTQYGFMMSRNNDKSWLRPADGVEVHIYGTGSMARVFSKEGKLLVDAPIAEAVKRHYKGNE